MPLVDGPEKVSGKAMYAADFVDADALVGPASSAARTPMPAIKVDASKARALPGVKAVVTGEDCAGNFGVLPIAMNEWALARGKTRYRGEPIAAVAAVDVETAARALDLIVVKLRKTAGLFPRRGIAGAGCGPASRRKARQSRARSALRARRSRQGLGRSRSDPRADLRLRRGLPGAERAARGLRRVRRAARPAHRALLDPGAVLRASDAVRARSAWTDRRSASSSRMSAAGSAVAPRRSTSS